MVNGLLSYRLPTDSCVLEERMDTCDCLNPIEVCDCGVCTQKSGRYAVIANCYKSRYFSRLL